MLNILSSNPLIDKATTDDEKEIPGYLFADISKLSYKGGDACERLRGHLLDKLKAHSPAVKIKTLLIIKYLLEHGHPHFQRILQQRVDDIQPCLDYKAPSYVDQRHGNAPSRMVQEKSRAVLNLLFVTRPDAPFEDVPKSTVSPITDRYGGMSANYSSPITAASNNFGGRNVNVSAIEGDWKPTPKKSSSNVVQDLVRSASNGFGAYGKKPDTTGNYSSGVYNPDAGSYKPAVAGYGFDYEVNEYAKAEQKQVASAMWAGNVVPEIDTKSPEESLVNDICTPVGNVRIPPTRQQLTQFLQLAASANTAQVCTLLAKQLSDQNWKRRLRALYALHELLQNNIPPSNEYFLDEGYALLQPLTNNLQQKTVRDKARQVLQCINPNYSDSNTQTTQTSGSFVDQNEDVQEESSLFSELQLTDEGQETSSHSIYDVFDNNDQSGFDNILGNFTEVQPVSATHISVPTPILANQSLSAIPSLIPTAVPTQPNPQFNQRTLTSSQNNNKVGNQTMMPQTIMPITPINPQESEQRPRQTSKSLLEPIFDLKSEQKIQVLQREINMQFNTPQPNPYAGFPPAAYPYPPHPHPHMYAQPMYYQYPPGMYAPVGVPTPTVTQAFGGPTTSVSSSNSFDFVGQEKKEKDPFDFIKVGQ